MTARALLLSLVRDLFPHWDVWVCDRGVWRASGVILISSSSLEGLLDGLGAADPDALAAANGRRGQGAASAWPRKDGSPASARPAPMKYSSSTPWANPKATP